MGQDSRIAWTSHTFNPWWGCTKVSDGCANCYAETLARRYGGDHWGAGKPRRVFGPRHWQEPILWDRRAKAAGVRARVFCASMADVCDEEAPPEERVKLWRLILATTNLDWLLLTKRPHRLREVIPAALLGDRRLWIGVTVEDQQRADERIPHLLATPAAVRFLSVEPLLGPINLARACSGRAPEWVIVGGESGPKARPCAVEWIEAVERRCLAAGVPVFVKQLGSYSVSEQRTMSAEDMAAICGRPMAARDLAPDGTAWAWRAGTVARAGEDPAEWPEHLRVRQVPTPAGSQIAAREARC